MLARWRAPAVDVVLLGLALASPALGQSVVRGLVVDAADRPVEGTTIRVFARQGSVDDGPALAEATSSATGTFELPPLRAAPVTLEVQHPDFIALVAPLDLRTPEPGELRLVLSRGARIEGRATLLHGTPLANLQVEVDGRDDLRALTHDDGSFVIDRVPPGLEAKVVLTDTAGIAEVARGVFVGARGSAAVREGEAARIVLHTGFVRIRGRLTRAGAPLAQVLLRPDPGRQVRPEVRPTSGYTGAKPAAGRRPPGEAVTTADGSFELFHIPGSFGYLLESPEGDQFYGRRRIEFTRVDESWVDLDLPAADTVLGSVVDKETGRGVPAAVQIRPQTGLLPDGEPRWWRSADGEGRFQFDLEPGEYIVGAMAQTYVVAEASFSSSGGAPESLRLEMDHTPSIRGKVVDPAGSELGGIPITAWAEEGRDLGHTALERDGSFRIFGLQQKRYNVLAGSPEVGWDMQAGVEAGAENLTLTLRPPGQLHLVVLSPDGQPVPNVFVTLRSVAAATVAIHTTFGSRVSDAGGRLELVVPPGTIELDFISQLYQGTLKVDVIPGVSLTSSLTLTELSSVPREKD